MNMTPEQVKYARDLWEGKLPVWKPKRLQDASTRIIRKMIATVNIQLKREG